MLSIVIPAHNEQDTLTRTLGPLESLGDSAELVVVCNGCTDNTAAVARRFAPWARVVEIDEASKPAALRRGDEVVFTLPRLYLDADVLIDAESVLAMVTAISAGPVLAVSPTPEYVFEGAGFVVGGHYRVWSAIQRTSTAVSGTGAILLSRQARDRFGAWPDVIGDDYFVSGLFDDGERARTGRAHITVMLPTQFAACVSRRARVYQGNRDVEAAGLRRFGLRRSERRGLVDVVRESPSLLLDVPAHILVTVASHTLARWRRHRGTHTTFHRGRHDQAPARSTHVRCDP